MKTRESGMNEDSSNRDFYSYLFISKELYEIEWIIICSASTSAQQHKE